MAPSPRRGLWGVAGATASLNGGVKLQKFSASPCSFLDVAYSQIGDLISINLFWGINPSVMGEWRNRSSWRYRRPQSSTGI